MSRKLGACHYLITMLLLEDLGRNRFSIVKFYERRARRILPALYFVLISTSLVMYFILLPTAFEDYSKSILSVISFVSNFYFWSQSNYFATESELIPLLHTWSLAVEEQYYIVFPIFLLVFNKYFHRFFKEYLFSVLIFLASISFIICLLAAIHTGGSANFFFPVTRAWEILIGSSVAALEVRRKPISSNLMSLVGLIFIGISIVLYQTHISFPGPWTLLPVFGSALIIYYGRDSTVVGQVLSLRPLTFIGLVSYSLYLFHQPVLATFRNLNGIELALKLKLAAIGISFFLAVLTWRFIENPFRSAEKISTKKFTLMFIFITIFLIVCSAIFINSNGAKWRYSFIFKSPEAWSVEIPCHGPAAVKTIENPLKSCLGSEGNSIEGDFYVVGDSHAAQFSLPLIELAKERNRDFHFIYFDTQNDFPHSFYRTNVFSDRALDHIVENADEGDFVVLAFHSGWLNLVRDNHLPLSKVVNESNKSQLLYKNMEKYVTKFYQRGIKVVLIKDGPLLNAEATSLEVCYYDFKLEKQSRCLTSIEQIKHTRSRQSSIFDQLAHKYPNAVIVVDPLESIVKDVVWFSPIDEYGEYLMRDRHHLTERGAMKVKQGLVEKLF